MRRVPTFFSVSTPEHSAGVITDQIPVCASRIRVHARTVETFHAKDSHTETKSRQALLVASSFLSPSCHRPLFSRFRYLDHARSPKQSHNPPGIPTFLANDQSGNIRRNAIIVNCLRVLCARAIASLPRRTASDPSHSHTSIHAFLQTSQRFASVSSRNLKRR